MTFLLDYILKFVYAFLVPTITRIVGFEVAVFEICAQQMTIYAYDWFINCSSGFQSIPILSS